jgi:hypothetical protein
MVSGERVMDDTVKNIGAFVSQLFPIATQEWHHLNLESGPWTAIPHNLTGVQELCLKLLWANSQIWHLEDYCRSKIDAEILRCKPLIDTHNQLRNDIIEQIDDVIVPQQSHMWLDPNGHFVTETPGSVIDRLSINTLKVYHWNELRLSNDKFTSKYHTAVRQQCFLTHALNLLLNDMASGTRQAMQYKQLKMYNNSETNPRYAK